MHERAHYTYYQDTLHIIYYLNTLIHPKLYVFVDIFIK